MIDDPVTAEPEPDCGGLAGQCPECIGLYRAEAGPDVPTCVLCGGEHWAYEDHTGEVGAAQHG